MSELEHILGETCQAIREKYSIANISEFFIEITVSGRVDTGELEIKYVVGRYHDDAKVSGYDLTKAVAEHMRRHGWEKANDYKALPAPKTISQLIDDEILF